MRRGGDGEVEVGLEVGLVEGGEDAAGVVEEELGVEVRLAVGGVGEAVHAFAGAGVGHVGLDGEFVGAGGEAGEGKAVAVEGGGVEGVPSRVTVWRRSGFRSMKVSPAVRAVKWTRVREAKVVSPVVRSRSTA